MDALSSQANVTGYAATLLAAREAGRFFPMMTTAAGTVAPAKVLVLGAGVAGLQAIATAKRLGAVVTGFDIRRAAWEQIASLGGRPLELDFIPDAEAEGGYARPLTDSENEQVRDALADVQRRPGRQPVYDAHGDRQDDRIADIKFEGRGCAISQASASLMSDMIVGRTVAEAEKLMGGFLNLVKGEEVRGLNDEDREKLDVMAGVSAFPMRVKCATLAWHTMKSALEGGGSAKTE